MASSASDKFKEEFEARSGDTIRCVVMARVYGSSAAILAAGLEAVPGKKDIWGLLIFGKNALHFFVHPSENYMSFLFRTAARAEPPKEQWAIFPKERIRGLKAPPPRSGLIASLFAKPAVVELAFASGEDAEKPASVYTLCFETIGPVKDGSLADAAGVLIQSLELRH